VELEKRRGSSPVCACDFVPEPASPPLSDSLWALSDAAIEAALAVVDKVVTVVASERGGGEERCVGGYQEGGGGAACAACGRGAGGRQEGGGCGGVGEVASEGDCEGWRCDSVIGVEDGGEEGGRCCKCGGCGAGRAV
jgi:hypothetical protein